MTDDPKTIPEDVDRRSYRAIAADAFRVQTPEGLAQPQFYDDVFVATSEQREHAATALDINLNAGADPDKS